ncbi:glycosyltransferase family 2 protein [Arcobacter peruensis]|uniref:glycosyltransferase family 2 protein n=1 Tax=Arcobacter peruensis TaxID=2320140 RepID=UPI000F0946E3|nr:glycosyltransferase [Arcobacter peruensis]
MNLVTVGVALYNHENYIIKCLESIVKQTYKNIELIVIDDGSPDNSFEVAKDYLESQDYNKNYKIYTRPNKGMCNTLNEIAKESKGKYISFVGSDDYWMLNKIEEQVKYLEENPKYMLVHSNSQVIDNDDNKKNILDYSKKKNTGFLFDSIIEGKGGINTPSHLYRTEVYEKIGFYDASLKFEDTDFWLRLTKNFEVGYINKIHTFYRWHEDNLSGSKNVLKFYYEEIVKIYNKNIDDESKRKKAVAKIYRKSFQRALRSGQFKYFFKYSYKYLKEKFS